MKNHFRLLLVVSFCLFLNNIAAYAAEEKRPEVASDFSLQDLERNTVTLSSYRGKQPVTLLFWTTWCPFCRKALGEFNDKYAQLQEQNWGVFAINVEESGDVVSSFVKSRKLNFRVLLDSRATVADAFDVPGVPTYVLIDKLGQVVFKGHYFPEDKYKELLLE